jgi:L-aminopeptidase/D-esterase-like protein
MRTCLLALLLECLAFAQPPVPRTSLTGKFLDFDFPAVRIGSAEYDEGPTGATVFTFPRFVMAAVDVRGGAPGTILSDSLRWGSGYAMAISLAGSAAYGLGVASGAMQELRDEQANSGDWGNFPVVPGAVIWDLDPRRLNLVSADEALGRAAVRAAKPGHFLLGAHGAGRFAMQGGYFGAPNYSGQGGAFRQVGPTKVAVFTVVNAFGAVVDRGGQVVRCSNDPTAGPCGSIAAKMSGLFRPRTTDHAPQPTDHGLTHNTTISLVVVNRKLTPHELERLAIQVHSSMARAIQPFHSEVDGDTLFAVTTSEVADSAMSTISLGVLASEVAWDAVLSSVPELDPIDKKTAPADPTLFAACAGRYAFRPQTTLTISSQGGQIWGEADGDHAVYAFRWKQKEELALNSSGDVMVKSSPETRLRFVKDGTGKVTGLILNPGHWPLPARRVR